MTLVSSAHPADAYCRSFPSAEVFSLLARCHRALAPGCPEKDAAYDDRGANLTRTFGAFVPQG